MCSEILLSNKFSEKRKPFSKNQSTVLKEQSRKIEKETESTKIENEIESTMTENATFPYKTALPEINVNHHRPDLLIYTP